MTPRIKPILQDLDLFSPESVMDANASIKAIPDLSLDEKLELANALTDIFFHAHHVDSTEMPKMALTVSKTLGRFGTDIIPYLIKNMMGSDPESAMYFGKALAKTKENGIQALKKSIEENSKVDHDLINLIQAFSYFKTSKVIGTIPLLIKFTSHRNFHVAAMAMYSLGRLVQRFRASDLPCEICNDLFSSIYSHLKDPQGLVRKNAARVLGKMLRKGLLNEEQEFKLYTSFLAITGKDDNHSWDRAFIVRREAEDFLPYFTHISSSSKKYTQSFEILSKRELCTNTFHFEIEAPFIARKIEAGQFVIIRPHSFSERIPISICGWDREKGRINIIISGVGRTTHEINNMSVGQSFLDVVGPLGNRSDMPHTVGTCVVIGGGYGTGAIIPTARDLKEAGNRVIGIIGARDKEHLLMIPELSEVCDEVICTTNDGSYGTKGLVTDALRTVISTEKVIHVLAVGPVPMMAAVGNLTKNESIPTYVSLNAIMVDGTGMCGACRVLVAGESKFACFHGPDFNAHQVDFDNLLKRQKMFEKQEKASMDVMYN